MNWNLEVDSSLKKQERAMPVEFRARRWCRYGLAALALAALAGPGNAGERGTGIVQHEIKLFNPLFDAILNGEKHVRKKAGKMLVEGDCAGAKEYALTKGRFDVADAVDQQCRAAIARASLAAIRRVTRRVYVPSRQLAARARPSMVAPIVINDYSVPTQR